ncbi:ATP-binding cassette domain-containing protein, partial [Mahella sp.]|uniref:ATP-binding cassette domain-containing protein n=1 Tax=Mahella sp. TaxID=2798721 RepID=UPI0025B8CB38
MDEYIVEMSNISKGFPGVQALKDVSFQLRSGEILALLGENGAGKSTLMKVLSGVYTKDEGEIKVFGQIVEDMTPKKAQELGIAIIHQELNLCPHLSVAENIFLGREKTHSWILKDSEMNDEARNILKRLNVNIDPEAIVGGLSVSQQQLVEIAK